MTFTFWILGLVALAGLAYGAKHLHEKRNDRRAREKKASKNRQSAAELDRKACLELAKGLNSSAPDEESTEQPERLAASMERARRASEAAHGFDPDLPPSRTSSSAR